MRRWIVPVLVLMSAAGCSRCGEKATPRADAGTAAPSARVVHGAIAAIELRSALFVIYPEFRGTVVEGGEARLTRRSTWDGDLAQALPPKLKQQGYSDAGVVEGEVRALRPPLEFDGRRTDGEVALSVALPLDSPTVDRLIGSPTPMNTEDLSLMLPRLPGERDARETFELRLEYTAKPARTEFLVRQLVTGLNASGWKSDAPGNVRGRGAPDAGELPSELKVTLTNADLGGRIEVQRLENTVKLYYVQPIAPR